jgi:2-amino-4-hydroxy-6-hydroxymethyldihydropteridine diphosphokinase
MKGKYLILGSNLGDPLSSLQTALEKIKTEVGEVVRSSSVYVSEPWGIKDQPAFYNQVVEIETEFSAYSTLKKLLAIETSMGRIRGEKWGERIIDIDILYFDDQVINTDNLIIPHPGIPGRRFVLVPLCELIPDQIHPVLNVSNADLLQITSDTLCVQKI